MSLDGWTVLTTTNDNNVHLRKKVNWISAEILIVPQDPGGKERERTGGGLLEADEEEVEANGWRSPGL